MSRAQATPPRPTAQQVRCAICQCDIAPNEHRQSCPSCNTPYHADCWQENGGCAVYGCSQVPATQKLADVEVPVSYWGQENKPCPVCGNQIVAVALRCRHCGATFDSSKPQDTNEFFQDAQRKQRAPDLQRRAVWTLVTGLIPFSAPFCAIIGWLWYTANHEEIDKLPSVYKAITLIGLGVAAGQTVLILVFLILFAVFG